MKRMITHSMFITFSRCAYTKLILFVWTMTAAFFATATTYNVTTFADGNAVNTLRGAITAANGSVGPHTINVPAGTYNLTLGQIRFGDISGQNITIQGTGGTAIINMTSTNRNRIFNINFDIVANVSTYLKNLTLRGGVASDFYGGATDAGGAVLCGGPGNIIDISNCSFENNTVSTAQGIYNYGGAITCLVSGTLNIDNCTFSGNIDPTLPSSRPGSGGAIFYDIYLYNGVAANGSVSVTNSTFTNNSTGNGGSGGAINIEAATLNPGQNVTVNISKNVFTGNSAPSGRGGAINIKIDRSTCNFNYNRFIGNTAGFGSGVCVSDDDGNVDGTNNWWACNGGPTSCADKAEQVAGNNGTGVLTATPFLQLRTTTANATLCSGTSTTVTASFATNSIGTSIATSDLSAFIGVPVSFNAIGGSISNAQTTIQTNGTATATYSAGNTAGTGTINAIVDNVPNSDATARTSITINTIPSVTSPGSTTVCAGSTATLSVTGSGSGTLSYQWFKGTTQLSNGGNYSGVTTSTLTISNTNASVAGTDYYVRVSSNTGCGPTNSSNATLMVNGSPTINAQPANATVCAGTTATFSISASGNGTLTYQWFKNTSQLNNGATGTGSTISGSTTPTLTISNSGTADAGTDYNVRITPSTGCAPTTSTNGSLTVNAVPSFTTQPTANPSTGICTGSTMTLSANYTGIGSVSSSSAQWFKGTSTTPLSTGNTGTGSVVTSISTSTTSATINIANVAAADSGNYILKITSSAGCGTTTSNTVLANVIPPSLPVTSSSGTKNISSSNYIITNTSCNVLANVVPSGVSPVSGSVTATVTVQSSVQISGNGSPYVPRSYNITPANNAATTTGTVTLYYKQAEFNAYNAYSGHGLNLPIDATDAANYKANIRIYVFHSGSPVRTEEINPDDNNIFWDGIYGRWIVAFNVVGFSEFFLASAGNTILPLNNIAFTGNTDGVTAWLNWKVTGEKEVVRYEVERGLDGIRFTNIGGVMAGSLYQFSDQPGIQALYYYRLKILDKDGHSTYSSIIAINFRKVAATVQVLPNPFREKMLLNIGTAQATTTELRLVDISGRVLVRKVVMLQAGTNAVTLDGLSGLAKGSYQLQVTSNKLHEAINVIKAE